MMITSIKQYYMRCVVLIMILYAPLIITHNGSLSLMSLNCYAFDTTATYLLKLIKNINLQVRTQLSTEERINKIAETIKQLPEKPDVIGFQELWLDNNKEQMIKALGKEYLYHYYIKRTLSDQVVDFIKPATTWVNNVFKTKQFNITDELNPLKMDSGLLFVSKIPFIATKAITFDETTRTGTEKQAYKGALFIKINDHNNNPVYIATTHLSAEGDNGIKKQQTIAIGETLKKMYTENNDDPRKILLVVIGDLNQNITYDNNTKTLIDSTPMLTDALTKSTGIEFVNPIVDFLINQLNPKNILLINSINNTAKIKNQETTIITDLETKIPSYVTTYFPYGTDGSGTQILDHILFSKNTVMLSWKTLTEKILGATGPSNPYDQNKALSDHSAIISVITKK